MCKVLREFRTTGRIELLGTQREESILFIVFPLSEHPANNSRQHFGAGNFVTNSIPDESVLHWR